MHIIIGLAMGVALLYWWLIGWWFARVLVFLLFGSALAIAGFMGGGSLPTETAGANAAITSGVVFGLLGTAIAWPIASLPAYYWRHQAKAAH